jgi:Protein of unknown function (DUF3551)
MYRNVVPLLVAAALMGLSATNTAQAREYPWCAYYGLFGSEATNCGFNTLAQCRATISGIGGSCQPNPAYRGRTTEGRSRRQVQRERY